MGIFGSLLVWAPYTASAQQNSYVYHLKSAFFKDLTSCLWTNFPSDWIFLCEIILISFFTFGTVTGAWVFMLAIFQMIHGSVYVLIYSKEGKQCFSLQASKTMKSLFFLNGCKYSERNSHLVIRQRAIDIFLASLLPFISLVLPFLNYVGGRYKYFSRYCPLGILTSKFNFIDHTGQCLFVLLQQQCWRP